MKKAIQKPRTTMALLAFFQPYRLQIFIAFIASIVGTFSLLGLVQVVRALIDKAFIGATQTALQNTILLFLALAFLMAFATYVRTLQFKMVGERVVLSLRQKLFNHVLTLDSPFFEKHRTGALTSSLTADVTTVQQALETSVPIALRGGVQALGGMLLMVYTSPKLSAIVLGVVLGVMAIAIVFGRLVRRYGRRVQEKTAEANAYITENIHGVRIVQSFCQEEHAAHTLKNILKNHLALAWRYNNARGAFFAFATFSLLGAIAAVFWFGGHAVLAGEISQGELSAVLLYSLIGALGIGSLIEVLTTLSHASGATERLFELLETMPSIKNSGVCKKLPPLQKGRALTFEGVTFTYPNKEVPTIKNVSFSVPAGGMVAIVGPSGAGKSTLFQLIPRFFEPQKGHILLDNCKVGELTLQELRQNIGLVAQDVFLFAGSILENICYGAPHATKAEVIKVAMLAHADGFIRALPQGYDTQIGERGVKLSGGQRQRLAIARALLVDPPLLLLDEATSHLDAASEEAVQKALLEVQHGRTTLAIAHRLATVQAADHILLMEDGRISASGTHKELLKKNKLYQKLAALQFLDRG